MQQDGGEVDEMGQTVPPSVSSGAIKDQQQPIIATRASTLRPRSSGMGSALPKYRPRSIVGDSAKDATTKGPPSPVRNSKRRSNSSSEDDSLAGRPEPSTPTDSSTAEKSSRPISPLPQRRATRSNTTLPAPTKITKPTAVTSPSTPKGGGSPVRRSKAVKTSSTSSASQNSSSVPRPSSSASSSSTAANRTPKSPSKSSSLAKTLARDKNNGSPSPMRTAASASPISAVRLSNKSKPQAQTQIQIVPAVFIADMSQINEEEDSEEDDVADMLAPIADLTAPTPAIPRLRQKQKISSKSQLNPQTPTRPSNVLPSRSQLSYISPLPPDKDSSASSLRPTLKGANGKIGRGSILTWEELADASRTLGEEEIGTLLSDIPAPFIPGQHHQHGFPSPTPSFNMSLSEVPESPCLSAMSSPGGYGSISQVLLPEFTPSPAVHASLPRFDIEVQGQAADSATITLLRLQLASVENTAKERLARLQDLEEEVHNLKSQRQNQAQELNRASEQMSFLEDTMVSQMRERAEKDGAYAEELEREMKEMQEGHQRVVTDAIAQTRRDVEKYYTSQTTAARKNGAAQKARSGWECVRSSAQQELEDMKGVAELIGFLRGELEMMHRDLDA